MNGVSGGIQSIQSHKVRAKKRGVIQWIVSATENVLIANAKSGQRAKKLMKMSEKLHLFYTT